MEVSFAELKDANPPPYEKILQAPRLMPHQSTVKSIQQQIDSCCSADRGRLFAGLRKIRERIKNKQPVERDLQRLAELVATSQAEVAQRRDNIPVIEYPDLPVSARREEIANTIRDHQVVVIAGETGSGKTTQLPKICLELGRGSHGLIGHTQPRRIAARTVASRIAEELHTSLGDKVGYQVRFNDQSSDNTYIKLMTDGILLAEIQNDRFLSRYDTIIIDEAHERSLNIDFLLGYLKQILHKRPDLKIIITSATIDVERFSKHFASDDGKPASIIEVSGRTYPVDVLYRPPLEGQDDLPQQILSALGRTAGYAAAGGCVGISQWRAGNSRSGADVAQGATEQCGCTATVRPTQSGRAEQGVSNTR